MKRFLSLFLILFLFASLFSNPISARAASWPQPPEIASASGIVMDFESGAIIYEKNTTEAHYPASITKIMTALVAIENSKLDEVVTFSHYAVFSLEPGSSHIARDEGEKMTMEECLYGLLLESANECANAIAEHVGGSIEGFAKLMNDKAKQLGCVNTNFVNPHGLHNDNHYTCAYDMALIARAAYEDPTFSLICGVKTHTIPPTNKHDEPTLLNNHHSMLHYYLTNKYIYDGCLGGKTGYTEKARGTLVTYAKRDGATLICVTMCGENPSYYTDTILLFDYYFSNMKRISVKNIMGAVNDVTKNNLSSLTVSEKPFTVDDSACLYLPNNYDTNELKVTFNPDSDQNSSCVGTLSFDYLDHNVGTALLNACDIPAYPFKNIEVNPDSVSFIKINILKILLFSLIIVAILLIAGFSYIKANHAVNTIRRRHNEKRDPHKNLRLIRKNRRRRNRRLK